jgi:hypothetical protein
VSDVLGRGWAVLVPFWAESSHSEEPASREMMRRGSLVKSLTTPSLKVTRTLSCAVLLVVKGACVSACIVVHVSYFYKCQYMGVSDSNVYVYVDVERDVYEQVSALHASVVIALHHQYALQQASNKQCIVGADY